MTDHQRFIAGRRTINRTHIYILSAIALLMGACGCGNQQASPAPETTDKQPATTPGWEPNADLLSTLTKTVTFKEGADQCRLRAPAHATPCEDGDGYWLDDDIVTFVTEVNTDRDSMRDLLNGAVEGLEEDKMIVSDTQIGRIKGLEVSTVHFSGLVNGDRMQGLAYLFLKPRDERLWILMSYYNGENKDILETSMRTFEIIE